MLPLQQAFEVKQSILEYLKATFNFKEKAVYKAFYDFIEDPVNGMFKGPYVSLKLPFETFEGGYIPLEIKPHLKPYKHQFQAFQRLTTKDGHKPEPTLLTTGTGSGKTESFLYPILDYCYNIRDKKGIKVIILYPMNALATDQAKRLAEIIFQDERLKGAVTAGLFIGEGKNKTKYPKMMGETNIIENRDEILANPPDILLTNFKMLDYGLMRHNYNSLWVENYKNPDLFQFLVLDELHAYDGAQGTDVANLIRRLKLKLDIPNGQLCPVGTSATIGKGEESIELLTRYASDVFGENFSKESVITEHRLSSQQFFNVSDDELDTFIPRIVGLRQSRLGINENYNEYIIRQKNLWQLPESINKYELSLELKKLKIVKDIASACSEGVQSIKSLIDILCENNTSFKNLPEFDSSGNFFPREEVITSILALIAEGKSDENEKLPFLFLQIQIWVRELSGLLREFDESPKFTWRDKIGKKGDDAALPPYYCRECGASGWLAVKYDNRNQFEPDPLEVYDYFFSKHKNVYLVNTKLESHLAVEEYAPSTTLDTYAHVSDLKLHDHAANHRIALLAYRKIKDQKSLHVCPECNTSNTINIIGTRVATLNSISVSQILSSDLDSRNEQYRKVLAFTNGVQDAAHQAGFVEARNYRFAFRASLQHVINEFEEPVNLAKLKDRFIAYWKNHADPSGTNSLEAYFYRFFPSDYIGKATVEDYRNPRTKKFSASFENEYDTRIYWEIISEFGYNANIGRTLEKTASSAAFFSRNDIFSIYPLLEDWFKSNNLDSIDSESFQKFLLGILHRMRVRGAVDHEYLDKFRSNDLKMWDLNWQKDKRHFLNRNFGPQTRIPKLLCTYPHNRSVLDSSYTNSSNWFHTYFRKSFPMAPAYNPLVNEFYEQLFKKLAASGILLAKDSKEGTNYALNPERILVGNRVAQYGCTVCSSTINTVEGSSSPENTKCTDYRCQGFYERTEKKELNYYNYVYNRASSPRIYASEHTGVLERKVREETEYSFKERPKFNSLNTLIATSTLEMGIDVGSLNSLINTSVPPLVSNFLQRIGRAGRSSGAALIENFAQNKAHDLFYYAEPLEMMEGDINTPGCFLNAKDILTRHFIAFCFDSWTKADPERNQLPGLLKSINLTKLKVSDKGFFINQLLDFLLDNQKEIFSRFERIYDSQIDPALVDEIRTSLKQGALQQRLIRVFENLQNEIFYLIKKGKDIDDYIADKGLGEGDLERKELEFEKKSLKQLRGAIEGRQVIEHLTNVGILPNYAFPETGVTLNAQVYGFKPEGAEQEPVNKNFEIIRSSSSALKEFAPDNFFYSQGNKLEITGINTFDWNSHLSSLVTMRFCSNCDHLEEEIRNKGGACPKCGHESWNSATNKHKFAKLKSVKSITSRGKSALNDSKDERDQKNYKISTHFKFNQDSIEGAWGMKKIPFGIEYVKDVELIKVNLGAGVPNAIHLTINQHDEISRHGFVTCRHCGKATSKPRDVQQFESKKFHFGYCKHRDLDYNNVPDDVFEEVFLFRNMKTEAIKILLPVQEFLNEAIQQMFKAGLELGLKKYYKGNPDHIAFEFYSEFNMANERFDRYLIAFDTVPGGTGYLQKLFDPIEFTALLTESYNAIRTCRCKNEAKDGCYRCILSYGNQYIREDLSRESAEELFGRIVRSAKEWEEVQNGISSLTKSGMIEESELELKFINSLKKHINQKRESVYSFTEFKENGILNYRLTLPIERGQVVYQIRPQFNLGEKDGISHDTRTDYLFQCISIIQDGELVDDFDELEKFKKVALYLDGYTYHASKAHLRFYHDLEIRDSINSTPNFKSWSLSWSDVLKFESEKEDEAIDEMFLSKNRYRSAISSLDKLPGSKMLAKKLIQSRNSIERLLWYLSNSNKETLNQELGYYLGAFQEVPGHNVFNYQSALKLLNVDLNIESISKSNPGADNYMMSDLTTSNELFKSIIFVRFKDFQTLVKIAPNKLTEINKNIWEQFLRIYSIAL